MTHHDEHALCLTCGDAPAVIEDYCAECQTAFMVANPDEFDIDQTTPWGTKFWEMSDAHKDAARRIQDALAVTA